MQGHDQLKEARAKMVVCILAQHSIQNPKRLAGPACSSALEARLAMAEPKPNSTCTAATISSTAAGHELIHPQDVCTSDSVSVWCHDSRACIQQAMQLLQLQHHRCHIDRALNVLPLLMMLLCCRYSLHDVLLQCSS